MAAAAAKKNLLFFLLLFSSIINAVHSTFVSFVRLPLGATHRCRCLPMQSMCVLGLFFHIILWRLLLILVSAFIAALFYVYIFQKTIGLGVDVQVIHTHTSR